MPLTDSTRYYQADLETMPRPQLEAIQGCLLAELVRRAAETPFYQARLPDAAQLPVTLTLDWWRAHVPLTSKADLRDAGTDAWHPAYAAHAALILATSGTTGRRIPLPYTRKDLITWGRLAARTLWTNGLRPTDTVLLPVPLGLYTGGHGMLGGLRTLGCRTLPVTPATTPLIAEALAGGFGATPTAIVALPSHMLRLQESLPGAGCDPQGTSLRIGSFGAEPWSEAARQRIHAGFRIDAVDSYGIGEICGPGIAAECEARDGMHVWEDAFFAEIIDPATSEPVADGAPGELVLTPLFRQALPLLRFRTGDETRLLPEGCACGRTHRRIARIACRLDDVLIVRGVNIDPGDLESILYPLPWVGHEFYATVHGSEAPVLALHVETRGETPPGGDEIIRQVVREHFRVPVEVALHPPGTLERPPGKARRLRRGERSAHGTAV